MRLKWGALNLRGRQFGDLTVLKLLNYRIKKKRVWLCSCSCGLEIAVRHDYLIHTYGPKTHCGCKNKGPSVLHPIEYSTYRSMLHRCNNPKHPGFMYYGGRGIKVCDRWQESFDNFFADLGVRPSSKFSIERKDANGDYSPENCMWATALVQASNKRNTVRIPHPKTGIPVVAREVADYLGLSYAATRSLYIEKGLWPLKSQSLTALDKNKSFRKPKRGEEDKLPTSRPQADEEE